MTVIYLMQEFLTRVKEIRNQYGIKGLLEASTRFALSPIYKSESYYLYDLQVRSEYNEKEKRPSINMDRLSFRVVTSNQEADKLEGEGLSFRTYPTYFNHNLTLYTKWLRYGAIANCTFVDSEFAAINWIITSQYTQKALKTPPVNVDYSNHMAFPRGAWVNPKYRSMELYRYTLRNRDRYLLDKGITKLRIIIQYTNKSGGEMVQATGAIKCGRAQLLKILFWKIWKEYLDLKDQPEPSLDSS
jgi:hypothetical protein